MQDMVIPKTATIPPFYYANLVVLGQTARAYVRRYTKKRRPFMSRLSRSHEVIEPTQNDRLPMTSY